MIATKPPDDQFSFDNSEFLQQPHKPASPECTFCDCPVIVLAFDNSWLWFVYKGALHFAHSECMQENVTGSAVEAIEQLLRSLGGAAW